MSVTYTVPNINVHYRKAGVWHHEPINKHFNPSTRTLLVLLQGAWLSDAQASYYDKASLGYSDVVLCLLHDTFVLNAWAADIDLQQVRLLPDGNGDLIKYLGCEVKDHAGVSRAHATEWEVLSSAIKYRGEVKWK